MYSNLKNQSLNKFIIKCKTVGILFMFGESPCMCTYLFILCTIVSTPEYSPPALSL